jgi:hypothetical protein
MSGEVSEKEGREYDAKVALKEAIEAIEWWERKLSEDEAD